MRYNSLTTQGHKLGRYLWDYHILKHLPASATAEMAPFVSNATDDEIKFINNLYEALRLFAINGNVNAESGDISPFKLVFKSRNDENNKPIRNIGVSIIKLNESRSSSQTLATMTIRQAEIILGDVINLFNSFVSHSNVETDLNRKCKRQYPYYEYFIVVNSSHGKGV